MIGLLGYNFFGDGNALDPVPTSGVITSSKLENGIFEHLSLSRKTDDDSREIPSDWVAGMVLNASFNGNLSAGTIQDLTANVTGYKIKRRKLGEFDWVTITQVQISSPEELTFTITDHLATSLEEYEYAFVPMTGDTEGGYIVNSIKTKFDGIFVADQDNIFKLDSDVQFDTTQSNQRMGIYEPFGKKYPVIINNGNVSYQTGALTGLVLNDGYKPGEPIDRKAIVAKRKLLLDFLNNRRPKIVKDWNGQAWLIMVTNNPAVNYLNGSGMGLAGVTFGWTEIGDVNSKEDLYDANMIPSPD